MSIFLQTKRLILKPTELSDLDHLIALRADPEVMKYIGNGSIQTKHEVKRFIENAIQYQDKHGFGFCSVFEKESGDFIGQAGLFHLNFNDNQPEIEVAYRLHKKFWGKGYATELTRALIQWGFQNLPIERLVGLVHPENTKSHQVLEKAGMTFTAQITYVDQPVYWYEIYKSDLIELVPYNKEWPKLANLEIQIICEILPQDHILGIEHVGSTAIPGMLAKPVIDIQIAVDSLAAIKQIAIDQLKTLGYVYWDKNPDKERMFFVKGMPPFGEKRSHHVHIYEINSQHWHEKIQFRDYLISHPKTAQAYKQLKEKLAHQYTFDREQYTYAKTQFIKDVLQKANLNH